MNFFDTLHKIQKKPEATRKKILVITVAVIMALIIFLWINNLKYSVGYGISGKPDEQKAPGPFSVFKETILKGLEDLKDL